MLALQNMLCFLNNHFDMVWTFFNLTGKIDARSHDQHWIRASIAISAKEPMMRKKKSLTSSAFFKCRRLDILGVKPLEINKCSGDDLLS
jgi:hypothetical protein